MKLIRFGNPGAEKPGLQLADGRWIDASGFGSDYDEAFFGGDGLARLKAWADANAATAPTVDPGTRLGPCVARPSKIVCIGLNYADHAKESGLDIPKEPIIFYIEHTVPVRYRRYVKEGILQWNEAFKKIGIDSAIEVYQQDEVTGAHMEKDPEDVRYNFIRWLNKIGRAHV